MNDVFHSFLRKFVLVFVDDILMYSIDKENNISHVVQVLELSQWNKLYVNHKKCEFGKPEVAYLGHVI